MKNRIVFTIAICFLLFVVSSCSSDFLEVDSTENIAIEDVEAFNSDLEAEKVVNPIYSKFIDMSSFTWLIFGSMISDDADKGSTPTDLGGDAYLIDALEFPPGSFQLEDLWRGYYQAINRAHQALDIVPQLDKINGELRERLIGEAKFLRALSYFYLVRFWGDVPLIDHVPITGNEEDDKMLVTRVSKDIVYDFIEKDLKEAMAVLPNKNDYDERNIGRASRGAAAALHAKVALYRKDWQGALDYVNEVEGYSLMDNFSDNFRDEGKNNQESIYEIQSLGGLGNPGIQIFTVAQAPRGGDIGGWGFNSPSQSLEDAFDKAGDEVRKKSTIIFRGDTLYDGTTVGNSVNERNNYKAYSPTLTTIGGASNTNIKIMRYAEVLLIKAEALNELGDLGGASDALNEVRNRVDLPDSEASEQEELRIAIWAERRLELAMEFDRWFDIVRTGQAEEMMAIDGKDFIVGKTELLPIPNLFIEQAGDRGFTVEQNPGY